MLRIWPKGGILSGDPLKQSIDDSIIEPNVWHKHSIDVVAELEKEGLTWARERPIFLVLQFQGIKIEQYLLENTQVIDRGLENIVLNLYRTTLFKPKDIKDILQNYDLSSLEVDLRKPMGDPDLILQSRVASNHNCRRNWVLSLVVALLVVDNFTEGIPSWEESSLNTLFSEMLHVLSLLVKRTPVLDLGKSLVQPSVVQKGHHLILI